MFDNSENVLIDKAKKGNIKAFGKIITPYEEIIYNIVYILFSDEKDAKNIAQEVFIKFHENLNKLDCTYKVSKELYKITINTCIDELNKKKNEENDGDLQLLYNISLYINEQINEVELKSFIEQYDTHKTKLYQILFMMSDFKVFPSHQLSKSFHIELINKIKNNSESRIKHFKHMHKKSIKALAMIVAICFIFVVIDICYNNIINTESVYLNELESTNQINFAQQDTINLSKTANISSGIDTNVIEDKKIIKTTHLSIQVYDFDNTIENLKQITHQHGGYIENSSSNIKYTDIENNSILKAGDIVLRVPAQNYTSVLNLVLKIGKVVGSYEQGEDVTTTYIDTEAVIDAKELEKERLMQLIEKADSINDLILLEDRLSQISSDIESYKSKIKNWDRLVQFSTITINIEQIQDKSKISTISPNLVDRIKDGFISSINNIKQQVENLIVLVAQFTPFLIILIIFLLLIKIICSCIRKSRKKKL